MNVLRECVAEAEAMVARRVMSERRAPEVQQLQVPRPRRALEGAEVVAIAAAAAGPNRS